jgi:hypothetical protein
VPEVPGTRVAEVAVASLLSVSYVASGRGYEGNQPHTFVERLRDRPSFVFLLAQGTISIKAGLFPASRCCALLLLCKTEHCQ